ncbi:MAG: putative ATP-dependent helicase [Acidimicrobiaceae bacterium]|nr:putative ATP-dependent helicase [Acidimicrobiaceae bacterium]
MPAEERPQAELADEAARRRIETDLDATLFVEAGAGTGKTRALVGRVVELVLSGRARLGQLAAITFTEAAAAELRTRIGARLGELAIESPADARVIAALGELDEAVVTTIHGFAQRLLAEHPLAAGLPLRIRVLDDFEADIEFGRRFSDLLDELLDEAVGGEVMVAALALGISPRHVEQLAWVVDEAWDLHAAHATSSRPGGDGGAVSLLPARVTSEAVRVAGALREVSALAGRCDDPGDALAVAIASLGPYLGSFDPSQGWLALLRWLVALPDAHVANKGAKENWSGAVAEAREIVGEYEDARRAALAIATDQVLGALLARLGRAAGEAAEARRSAGTLRFHDLLVYARDLLVSDADVLAAVRRRYVQVLVDEFQDTDELQLEIVRLVAGETEDGVPRPGRLFFVGDPKQAIYRFRGADVALYERVRAEVAGGQTTELVTNFRSVPGVLGWVNRTFEQLVHPRALPEVSGEPEGGANRNERSSWVDLVPARAALSDDLAVTVLGGPTEGAAARERRRSESEQIASTIVEAVRDGWPVLDGEEVRGARFRDVALLVPRRTALDELESALDARDVPYRVQSNTLVYSSTEVRDLLACLRAVDSPGEEAVLVAALRTPELACGDDELLEYHRAGGQWRIDAAPPPGFEEHPVARALAELRRLHGARHALGVAGTLEAIVSDRCVLQLAAGLRRHEEAWRRIMIVVDHARGFVDAGGGAIADLLAWTDRQSERTSRASDPVDDDHDAVRILTVHGAKGLEFPIVVLADLGGRPPARRGASVLSGPGGTFEARLKVGLETAGYADLAAVEAELELGEQLRLCYVAATRARDHLVVSLHHTPASRVPSLAELLWEACQKYPELWRHLDTPAIRPVLGRRASTGARTAVEPRAVSANSDLGTSAGYAAWLERRGRLVAELQRPASVAAGSLASPQVPGRRGVRAVRAEVELVADEAAGAEGGRGGWHGRRAATELGRAVHGVLQRVDLASGEGLDALAVIESTRHGCPNRAAEVRALALSALEAPVVRAAARAGSLRREVPVSVPVAGGILEGVVDLCFEDGSSFVVVDYKTDALEDPSDVPLAALRYRPQVGAYALALETVLGRPVDRCVLVFLARPDGAVQHEVVDLRGAAAAARAEIEQRLAGVPAP